MSGRYAARGVTGAPGYPARRVDGDEFHEQWYKVIIAASAATPSDYGIDDSSILLIGAVAVGYFADNATNPSTWSGVGFDFNRFQSFRSPTASVVSLLNAGLPQAALQAADGMQPQMQEPGGLLATAAWMLWAIYFAANIHNVCESRRR